MIRPRVIRPIVRPSPPPGSRPVATSASLADAAPDVTTSAATTGHLAALRAICQGQTVYVMASGPSLTPEDVMLVRRTGCKVFVTNTTFKMAPWATALVANDRKWWRHYRAEVDRVFTGLLFSGQPVAPDICNLKHAGVNTYRNSGAAAISLAIHAGAKRVICLGLDCAPAPDGSKHWHGDHPAGLGNAGSLGLWQDRIAPVAAAASKAGVEVLNASRHTALTCFQRVKLEDYL